MTTHPIVPTKLLLAALVTMTVFALIPSQVPGARNIYGALHLDSDKDSDLDSLAGDKVVYSPPSSPGSSASVASSSASSTLASAGRRNRKKKIHIPRTGNLPDVNWRAIPMSHLRSHPNFQPLPPPSMIGALPTREHARFFRQESWQWDLLHAGRCTTSQAASALGFLEPRAAHYLGIPRSLQRGGVSAWDRLREAPGCGPGLAEMEGVLCEGRSSFGSEEVLGSWRPGTRESDRLWVSASRMRINASRTKPFPFAAKYIPNLTFEELHRRKLHLEQHHLSPSPMKTRMQWGNAQEATSILTALNYFFGKDDKTTLHEMGMCGARFDDGDMADPLLKGVRIGASPDAVIRHGDGTVEVLEVKNHCPFVWNRISPVYATKRQSNNKRKKTKGKRKKTVKSNGQADEHDEPKHYLIRDFQLEREIPPLYIPQLMMEMLCVGDAVNLGSSNEPAPSTPVCSSAIMVRQTATKGAILLRLQRDEEWIREMKYWLGRFQSEYVETGIIPPDNFFYDDDPNSRYRRFLRRTKELSQSVEQVAFIDHGRIQRMVLDRGVGDESLIPLFLDRLGRE